MSRNFEKRLQALQHAHDKLIRQPNKMEELGNGVYERYKNPVLTAQHTPL